MNENMPVLKIDTEFKTLIRPLSHKEYLQLEENLLADGCREPIATWNGFIIDGHNRYEICNHHQIEYQVKEMHFTCREEVIAWICKNQLGRRNITEETRKYLIGRQYESEKIVNQMRGRKGANQYTVPKEEDYVPRVGRPVIDKSNHKTAQKIANQNNVTHATVQKYSTFTKALDAIREKEPSFANKILAGKCKVSHKNLLTIASMDAESLKRMNKDMESASKPFVQYSKSRDIITKSEPQIQNTVKDMPSFDPDASVIELSLTIPSWTSSIKRTQNYTDIKTVSQKAKERLNSVLSDLQVEISKVFELIKE